MTQFIAVDRLGTVLYAVGRPDVDDGAIAPADTDEITHHRHDAPLVFGSTGLTWAGATSVRSTITTDAALALVDAAADEARTRAGGGDGRVAEYARARTHAEAFRDSDWSIVPVPTSVAVWAAVKGITARQSAEDILRAAAESDQMLDQIRAFRLTAKEQIRKAQDPDTITGTVGAFQQKTRAMFP